MEGKLEDVNEQGGNGDDILEFVSESDTKKKMYSF